MTPLVSILIPTLERPQYLKEAIDAALAQTYRNIEVLVFDNGTMGETRAVAEEAARRDGRVIFRRHGRNLGMSANFNTLADAARGEFLVAIGDDDRLLPEFVSRLLDVMRPEVDVVFSNHYLINAEGRRLEEESIAYTRKYGRDVLPAGLLENPEAAVWQQSIPMGASLLRAGAMQRLRFREDLNTPDVEFFIRLALEGGRFIFLPDYLMEYRVHRYAESASGLWSEQLVDCLSPIVVKPEVEPYKRQFLTPMVVNAVSRCLQQGQMEMARKFLQNEYYPRRHRSAPSSPQGGPLLAQVTLPNSANYPEYRLRYALGGLLQNFCANLPAALGAPIYRAIRRMTPAGLARRHSH